MMLCIARAYVEKYNPKIKLSQKQLIKMVHQIQPTEPFLVLLEILEKHYE